MRKLFSLAIGVALGGTLVLSGRIAGTNSFSTVEAGKPTSPVAALPPSQDPPGTIDGAAHPELIADHFGYLVMFRMISNRNSEAEIQKIRAYIRQVIGLGKQSICDHCRPSTGVGDADIDALIAAAKEFHQRVTVVDEQATRVKDSTWPNPSPEVITQLVQLQTQKDARVDEIAASLANRLSAGGLQRVREHINNYVKRNIKLTPAPKMPPSGPDWHF